MSTEETPTVDVKEFKLKYQDQDGKIWHMKRTKGPRAFLREDGIKLSHTFVRFNYKFVGRAYYRYPKKAKIAENATN